MCHVFASQDPAIYQTITRSVRLNGFSTSIRLEALFWSILDQIAKSQDMSTGRFISTLHDEVLELRGELRLVEEHPHERLVARAVPQDALEDAVALDAGRRHTAREKDLGHASRREPRQDLVVVRGRTDLGHGLSHRCPIVPKDRR